MLRFVKFPDGTEIRAASLSDRRENDEWRGFGLYLDTAWHPTWQSNVLGWEDFGLPSSPPQAVDQILSAFMRAREGEHVELGCKGGLGRTGTVIACMAVLAGVAPEKAVSWARRNYDRDAIETHEQEQWVLWFAAEVGRRGRLADRGR